MIVEKEMWNEIPLLHVYKEEYKNEQTPVVVFLHGFTSAKEHNLHYAYQLAEKGLRILLPDAHLHGERHTSLDEVQLSLRFWEVVLTSIEDVKYIREELLSRHLISEETKIALAGTSMGGIETLGCLKVYPWIDVAAVLMGSPSYVQLAKAQMAQYESRGFKLPVTEEERKHLLDTLNHFDLSKDPTALNSRPVFFWHGEQDTVVPYEPTYNFYDAVKKSYANHPERFQFQSDKMAGHAVTRQGLLNATDFIAENLSV